MPKKNSNEDVKSDERVIYFVYEVMENRLTFLKETFHAWMSKISFFLTFVGLVLTFYLSLFLKKDYLLNIYPWLVFFRISTFILLFLSLLSLMMAAKNRDFGDAPNPNFLYSRENLKIPTPKFENKMISNMIECYSKNTKLLGEISIWMNRSWFFLMSGLIFLAVSILF